MPEIIIKRHPKSSTEIKPATGFCEEQTIQVSEEKFNRAKVNKITQCPTCGASVRVDLG